MSLSRAELQASLWGTLQRPFTEVGIANTDTTGNLKEPLDATLYAMGTAYADLTTGTIADGSEFDALKVARYYGLSAIYDAALNRVDVRLTDEDMSRSDTWSQFVKNLKDARDEAKADAAPFLPADGSWGAGSLSLGFIPLGSDTTETWAEWWA